MLNKLFNSAILKLTLYYVFIVMMISLSFSFVIYSSATRELDLIFSTVEVKNNSETTYLDYYQITKIKNNEYYFSGSTMPCPELSIEIENEAKDIFKGMIVSKIIGNKDFGFPLSKYFLEFANSKRAQITKDTSI